MMHIALRTLGAYSEDSAIVGDRIDTDIVAGIESGLRTILVLTGVTSSFSLSGGKSSPSTDEPMNETHNSSNMEDDTHELCQEP